MTMSPSDLRAEVARRRATLYKLAADVGLYPGRLGRMLNEREPMPSAVADRLALALAKWDGKNTHDTATGEEAAHADTTR